MADPEIRLQCLEHALTQAKGEGEHGNVDRVAQLAEKFYAWVMNSPAPPEGQPEPSLEKPTRGRPRKVDKSDPFA